MAAVFKSVSHDVAADVLRRIDWADAGNILVRMEDRSAIGNHFYRVDRVGMLNKRTCREHEFCGSPISASSIMGMKKLSGEFGRAGCVMRLPKSGYFRQFHPSIFWCCIGKHNIERDRDEMDVSDCEINGGCTNFAQCHDLLGGIEVTGIRMNTHSVFACG